jgi:hypothetical protein
MAMNVQFHILVSLFLVVVWIGCKDSGSEPLAETGLQGQVFLISTPGPIPEGWVPPPLKQVSTIVVLDQLRKIVEEAKTGGQGSFLISLQPGSYYLRVKESPIPAETGPFKVVSGRVLSVYAHFDNGMR